MIAGIVLTLAFVGMIVWLIIGNNRQSIATQQAMVEADSLRMANEQLVLANEFNQLQAELISLKANRCISRTTP